MVGRLTGEERRARHDGRMTEQRDEARAFAEAYTRCLPAVSGYLRRRVDGTAVEDLAADVFAIAWRKRAAVAPGEELPWLYRIASYVVANHRRRLATRASLAHLLIAPDSAPAADAFVDDAEPALAAAWAALRPRDREVLALAVLEGMPVAEIAVAAGSTPNAVSIRLHRAKKALAAALERERTAE